LKHVESLVKESAQTILDGRFRLAPFVDGAEVACAYCPYAAVCRFDPLIDKYRPLNPATILVKATPEA
jgi:ATP-dependent helicase/nuclease subunit B